MMSVAVCCLCSCQREMRHFAKGPKVNWRLFGKACARVMNMRVECSVRRPLPDDERTVRRKHQFLKNTQYVEFQDLFCSLLWLIFSVSSVLTLDSILVRKQIHLRGKKQEGGVW